MKLYLPVFRSVFPLLFLTLVFSLSAARADRKLIDRSVVVVNDEVILDSDIDKFQQKLQSKSFQELFGGVDDKVIKNRQSVLQLLIEEKILNQQVKKLELTASDQEVDGQIRAITKRNGITLDQLTERLKQLGTTMAEYRDGIRRQLERKNLIDREIRPSMEITDEQLRHFYLRNAKPEDAEMQYKIAQILIEKKDKGGVPAETRAKKIWEEVSAKPEDFEKFAKDYSDDSSNSTSGGNLGFFSASSLAKEFREVVPKTPVGQITKPIKTAAGFHIVKVLESHAGDFSTLPKERKDALRMQMQSVEMEKKMGMWLERKKNEAHIQVSQKK